MPDGRTRRIPADADDDVRRARADVRDLYTSLQAAYARLVLALAYGEREQARRAQDDADRLVAGLQSARDRLDVRLAALAAQR